MSNNFISLGIRIEFKSPFHIGTGYGAGLLDRSVSRDHKGHIYLPGSNLKGKIRNICEDLALWLNMKTCQAPSPERMCRAGQPQCIICRIFGSNSRETNLYFDNAYLADELKAQFTIPDFFRGIQESTPSFQTWEKTQIRIDRRTGTTQRGHLLSSEYGVDGMAFRGEISGRLDLTPLDETQGFFYELMLLIAGIRLVQNIGLGKTIGHGRCSIKIERLQIEEKRMEEAEAKAFGDKLCQDIEFLKLYQEKQEEGVKK